MNGWTSWQYRPLTIGQEAERDVLLRLWIRILRRLIERRLVKCDRVTCEQREVQRVRGHGPGVYHYPEKRTLHPDPDWGWDHPLGQWTVEACVQVDEEDRGESVTLPRVGGVEGQILWQLFGQELERADPRRRPRRRRKVRPKARAKPVRQTVVVIHHGRGRMPLAAAGQQVLPLMCN